MKRRFASLSIRARLMIVLVGMSTVAVILFAIFSLTTLRDRSIELARELMESSARGTLNLIQMTVSAEEARAAASDPAAAAELQDKLTILAEQFTRNEASLVLAVPDSASGWQVAAVFPAGHAVTALPEQYEAAERGAISVVIDENTAVAVGGMALLDENGVPSGAALLTIDAAWLFEGRNQILLSTLALALILYPAVIIAAYLISGLLTHPLQLFTSAAVRVERGEPYSPELLKPIEQYSDELGKLARIFDSMAAQVQAREDALKQQVKALEIQIDRVKQQEQVDEITDNDFFRDLQKKKDALRARSLPPSNG